MGMRSAALAAVAALGALATPGCFWLTTKHEGNRLRSDVAELEKRIAKQEESLDAKVKQLDESLDKATKLLARNSADLGADVQKLSSEMASMNGEVEGVRRELEAVRAELALAREENLQLRGDFEKRLVAAEARVAELEKQLATGAGTKPPPTAAQPTKEELFASAMKKLEAGQLTDARKELKDFLKKYPQDDRADDAQYWLGEIYYREQQYEKAIGEFQKVIDGWPNGDMVDDAFFQAGMSAVQMKWCTDAKAYFSVLVSRFKQSPLVKKAQQQLDYLKKNSRNKQVCQS